SVVPYLLNSLLIAIYYIYLNNLFTLPQLFKHLRVMNIAATGICYIALRVVKDLVHLKKTREKGPNVIP
ncbi:hypothetical protein DL98DRAFT_440932, partial [Cadophora sp. DSE1049]